MATQLRLNKHQLSDLQIVRDIDLGKFDQAVKVLSDISPPPLQPKDLEKALASIFEDKPTVDALLRQLLSLHSVMGQMSLKEDEIFSGLAFGIKNSDAKWDDSQTTKWNVVVPKFRELLSLNCVRIVAKALNLSYQYPNLLRTSRILTDIRPVFNGDASEMDGAVISHSLSVHFDNVDGNHSSTFALDEKDIRFLKEQCERALQKAETARKLLETKAGLSVVVSGRE